MSTCDRLDLQTLGSQPMIIMPKNLPDHCYGVLKMVFHQTNISNLTIAQYSRQQLQVDGGYTMNFVVSHGLWQPKCM
jgi:hypothetical protein